MAKSYSAYVTVDMSSMVKFAKYVRSVRKQKVYEAAAERFIKFLQNRYIALSSKTGGSAEWPKLADKTIEQKKLLQRKGKLKASNPEWILRRTNTIVNSFSYKVSQDGFMMGILTNKKYPMVYKSDTPRTIKFVAQQHQVGNGRVPQRRIVVIPPLSIRRLALQDIQRGFNKWIAEANPKGLKK